MRIEKVAVTFPSRRVTNDDVIGEIEKSSKEFSGDLTKTLTYIRQALRITGSAVRYWVEEARETSLSLTIDACRKAISGLNSGAKIDLVICASVFSELIEPATANLIAHELGLEEAECFDVKEACDGWVKAMKIADALINGGAYERVLVVNGEFSMTPGYAIQPDLFRLTSRDELAWCLPIFTIGEAAAATVVERDASRPWNFTNITRNDLYDLCTVTPAWQGTAHNSRRVAKDGAGWFTSWAHELSNHGIPLAIQAFKKSGINAADVDILFTHASATKDWAKIAREIALTDKFFDIHPRTGNLVSASIPAAMALALEEGRLARDQDVAVLCASAGMTFSTAYFQFSGSGRMDKTQPPDKKDEPPRRQYAENGPSRLCAFAVDLQVAEYAGAIPPYGSKPNGGRFQPSPPTGEG